MQVTSEGPQKITKATIDNAWRRRSTGNRLIIRDNDCRGLALVVNPTTMTWTYAYRLRGTDPLTGRRWPNRTVTLGNPSTHSPDDARTAANQIKGQAAAGDDPASEKRARIEAETRRKGATLGRLVGVYASALPHRPKMRGAGLPSASYVAEELAQVRLSLDTMKAENVPAYELTEARVRTLVSDVQAGASVARKRFGALSRFLDWCQEAGHIPVNPCGLLPRSRRPKAPQARSHYLSMSELAAIWHAAGQLRETVWRDATRFLIAVPCRRNEAARLEWSHIDLDAAIWRQPGKLTKNRDPHRFHLHPLAIGILRERHKITGGKGLVFPAPESGKALDTFTRLKTTLSEKAQITEWTWHDFRRSFATALGEASIAETVADAILNHRQAATRGGVLGVYQRASRWPEQVRAMEIWGQMLTAEIDGREPAGTVIAMVARAG